MEGPCVFSGFHLIRPFQYAAYFRETTLAAHYQTKRIRCASGGQVRTRSYRRSPHLLQGDDACQLGLSLPGTFEEPKAPVYVDGRLFATLKGDHIVAEFIKVLDEYVESHYAARSEETVNV